MKYSQSTRLQNIVEKDGRTKHLYDQLKSIERTERTTCIVAWVCVVLMIALIIVSIFFRGFEVLALLFYSGALYNFSEINRLQDKAYYTVMAISNQYEKDMIIKALKR